MWHLNISHVDYAIKYRNLKYIRVAYDLYYA
jgi:hypothetical protein